MRYKGYIHSLRFKITVGITLPLIVILGSFSYLQYTQQRALLLSNLNNATTDTGTIIVDSLERAMLSRDLPEIQGILNNIATQPQVSNIYLLSRNSVVGFAPNGIGIGTKYTMSSPGCIECHAPNNTQHPSSIIYTTPQGERLFRNCTPIENKPVCHACHNGSQQYNGVLITDISMQSIDRSLADGLRTTLLWSGAVILATIIALNTLMSRLVITRLERLAEVLRLFSHGDLSQRVRWNGRDEIGALAASFNFMAEGLGEKARLEEQVIQHAQELERLNTELRHKEVQRGQLLDRLINAQEEERKRIARDLHDQLGAILSGLTLGIEAFRQSLALPADTAQSPPQSFFERIQTLATQALDETHRLIFDLRPVALDELGLVAAVRADAEQRLPPRGVEVQVSVSGVRRRMAAQPELSLFRIVQEAINNIVRHAEARHTTITFEFEEAVVRVTIEDDGRGFDVETESGAADSSHGLGLLGMAERAQLSGGMLKLTSRRGHGTRIEVTMPLAPEKR